MRFSKLAVLTILIVILLPVYSYSEIKIIEAESTYIIGDNDSKIDARRIATQEAKRKALETAGTYVESLTEVKNMAVTKDEIKAYTAGIVETEIISEEMKGTTERPEIYIKARCKVDSDVLIKQITSYKQSEDLKTQLSAVLQENEKLKKERDQLTSKLATEKDKTKAEVLRKDIDKVLIKEEANEKIRKVLIATDITDQKPIQQMDKKEIDEAIITLQKFIKINPDNPNAHVSLFALYRKKGDFINAEKEIKEAIKIDPKNPIYHNKLGLLFKDQGKNDAAIKEFLIVWELKSDKPQPLFMIGMIYKDAGNCNEAVSYMEKFLLKTKNTANISRQMKSDAMKMIKECGKQKPLKTRPVKKPKLVRVK